MAPRDDTTNSALPWAPAVVGAGVGLSRARKEWTNINPSAWFTNLGAAGADMREVATEAGLNQTAQALAGNRHMRMIEDMHLSLSYMSMPHKAGRAAIDEALRASLLRGRSLPMKDIEILSQQLRGVPYVPTRIAPGAFGVAKSAVALYGDPRVFYENLMRTMGQGDIPSAGFTAGERFTGQELGSISRAGRYALGEEAAHKFPKIYSKGMKILNRIPKSWTAEMQYFKAPAYTGADMFMGQLSLSHPSVPEKVRLNVPLTEGWYRSGRNMESLYTTQGVISPAGDLVGLGEHQLASLTGDKGLLSSLESSKGLTKEAVRNQVRAFNENMSQFMVYTPSTKLPSQEILNMIHQKVVAAPHLAESAIQDELMGGYYGQDYYPTGTPATIAKGKMLKGFDPRSIWPNADVYPIERRPLQALREYSPTGTARQLMDRGFGPGGAFRRDAPFLQTDWWAKEVTGRGQVAPQMSIAYALPGQGLEKAMQAEGLAAEELLLRKKFMPMLQTQSIREEVVAGTEYFTSGLKERIVQGIETGKFGAPIDITAGQRIAYGLGTGEDILGAKAPGLSEAIVGAEPFTYAGGEAGVRLQIQQTHTPKWYAKLFGQLKATTVARNDTVLNKMADKIGLPFLKSGVDGYAYIDELRKNRAFLRMQMQSGLAMSAAEALEAGRLSPKYASEARGLLEGGWGTVSKIAGNEIDVLRTATRWGLPLGPIGGAMPHALSRGQYGEVLRGAAGFISPKALHGELKGAQYALGLASPTVGGFRYTGGGGERATMEPRGFTQLFAREGEAGYKEIGAEIARSMKGYGSEINELSRTMATLGGETLKGIPVVDVANIDVGRGAADLSVMEGQGYIRKEAYIMKVGQHQVYVPPYKEVRGLDQFRLSGGELKAQSLQESFYNLARTGKNLKDTVASAEAVEASANALRKNVLESMSVALAGKSQGGPAGAVRGRMAGSMFLAPSTGKLAPNMIEISQAAATDMFNDLTREAVSAEEKSFIEAQREAFFYRKERIPMITGRHGLIGPHSLQPIWGRLAQDAESKAGEYFMRIGAPQVETVSLGKKIAGIGKAFRTDVSPLLGLAMDFDDDRSITKLIGSKKTHQAVTDMLASGRHIEGYRKFAAEAGLLQKVVKSRAAQSAKGIIEASDTERLISGSRKLRIGVGHELGQLSTVLSEAKMAMAMHAPEKAYRFNILAELMEQQTAIGGKNIGLKGSMAANIAESMKNIHIPANQTALTGELSKLFGTDLEKGVRMSLGKMSWDMAAVKPEQITKDVQTALGKFRAGPEGDMYKRIAEGARGFGPDRVIKPVYVKEMQAMIEMARANKLDPTSALAMREAGLLEKAGSGIARDTLTALNRAKKSVGAAARSWGKPLLYGLVGTAALSMLMGAPEAQPMTSPAAPGHMSSRTRQNIQAVSGMSLQGRASASRDLRPESLSIPGSVTGAPTAPGMMSSEMYLTTSPPLNQRTGYTYRGSAMTGSRGAPDRGTIRNALAQAVPGAASIDVTYNDNRRTLTAQSISDMLEGF